MSRSRVRAAARRGAVVAMVGVVVLVSGCQAEEVGVDYLQAKAELLEVVEATQIAVGGEWEKPNTWLMECPRPSGGIGVRYGYSGGARGEFDAQAGFEAATPVWEAAGLTAREGEPLRGRRFYADGPGGLIIEFAVGPAAQTIGARSDCVAGDAAEILDSGLD